jgi:hypothetical protein
MAYVPLSPASSSCWRLSDKGEPRNSLCQCNRTSVGWPEAGLREYPIAPPGRINAAWVCIHQPSNAEIHAGEGSDIKRRRGSALRRLVTSCSSTGLWNLLPGYERSRVAALRREVASLPGDLEQPAVTVGLRLKQPGRVVKRLPARSEENRLDEGEGSADSWAASWAAGGCWWPSPRE